MKLPRSINGRHYFKHPLVTLCEKHGTSEVGRKIGVHHSSVNAYYAKARKNRDALVPATWALPLAELLNEHPAVFRPDLYPRALFPIA